MAPERINNAQLAPQLTQKTGHPLQHTRDTLDALADLIQDHLAQGTSVTLRGLGTFYPRTPPRNTITFSASTTLKAATKPLQTAELEPGE